MKEQFLDHPIPPVYDRHSRILILGSFPSVLSRQQGFFYGHPQNRFWKVLAAIFNEQTPSSIEEKKAFLLKNRIAVWDVIASCTITGSSDSSIKNVIANDLTAILKEAPIELILANGRKAYDLYNRYEKDILQRECLLLPSTSPANAAWSLEKLISEWKNYLLAQNM